MALSKLGLRLSLLILCLLATGFCSRTTSSTSPIVFVGSTPGDELIKSLLTIPPSTKVDFIRWNLIMNNIESKQQTFVLTITFGEAKPNTLGFMNDDGKLIFEGEYTVVPSQNIILNGIIYHFKSTKLSSEIIMVKLNENIFHLLTPQYHLMIGNGGWSYTLNRKEAIPDNAVALPVLSTSTTVMNDTSLEVVYDGRTPCQDFATEHNMRVSSSCFKLKWKLILRRDPITHKPTTYTMRKVVDNKPRDVSGNWTIINGIKENSEVIIYQLDPEDSVNSICLLTGDENVLFFLDKKYRLYTVNGDFSYTLNKRP